MKLRKYRKLEVFGFLQKKSRGKKYIYVCSSLNRRVKNISKMYKAGVYKWKKNYQKYKDIFLEKKTNVYVSTFNRDKEFLK